MFSTKYRLGSLGDLRRPCEKTTDKSSLYIYYYDDCFFLVVAMPVWRVEVGQGPEELFCSFLGAGGWLFEVVAEGAGAVHVGVACELVFGVKVDGGRKGVVGAVEVGWMWEAGVILEAGVHPEVGCVF